VGDAWATDIEGARAAGVRPVWLNRFGALSRDPAVAELQALEPIGTAWHLIVGA
jgi:putative hydrolase of the HAD superfamily